MKNKTMVTGSCLCGEIKFEVELLPNKVYNCHCSQCRKSHGSSFATQAFAKGRTLKIKKGQTYLSEYKGDLGIRAFCKQCGSKLMNYAADKNIYLSIALASIDGKHNIEPVAHAYVDSKADWYHPSTDIPSFSEIPDGALD